MDAYAVARLIEEIGATSSRAEKEELVASLVASDLGRFVVKWAYDPMITYGIKPGATESSGKLNLEFKQVLIEPLLVKLASRELTGKAAEAEVAEVMQALNKDGARLLFLVLSKDLKCGIAESTINGVMPGLIPIFSVARANSYEAKKIKSWPQKAEFKLDGQRNTLLVRNGQGGFFTRSGKIVPALEFLVAPVLRAAKWMLTLPADHISEDLRALLTNNILGGELNFMLDGEAMMGLFAERGALSRKGKDAEGAELHLYDILTYDDFDAVETAGPVLADRRNQLAEFVTLAKRALGENGPIQIVPQYFVNSDDEAQAFFERALNTTLASYLARGNAAREEELLKTTIDEATGEPKMLEGAVIKDPKAQYLKKKSNAWLKLKAEETEDLRIVGFFNGQEHTKLEGTTGGVIVMRDGVEVRMSGMRDPVRAEMYEAWLHDAEVLGVGRHPGFKGHTEDLSLIMELHEAGRLRLLGRLAEVKFHEVTPDGSLRHPRFIRFRDDKDGEVESKEAA